MVARLAACAACLLLMLLLRDTPPTAGPGGSPWS